MEMDSSVNLSVMASLEEVPSIAYGTHSYYYSRRVCLSPLYLAQAIYVPIVAIE